MAFKEGNILYAGEGYVSKYFIIKKVLLDRCIIQDCNQFGNNLKDKHEVSCALIKHFEVINRVIDFNEVI